MQLALLAQDTPLVTDPQPPVQQATSPRPPFGLSKAHIGPHHVISTAVGGRLVTLGVKWGHHAPTRGGGRRGKVAGFSDASRRRLLRLFASIDRRANDGRPPITVTLTYPGEHPSAELAKTHLRAFEKRLTRQYPLAATIWRLELQQRGAAHFHLAIFGPRFIPHQWVARAWFEVVGSNDPKHLEAGTETRAVRSWKKAAAYFSKYIAKKEQLADDGLAALEESENMGRNWGIMGRKNLPIELRDELVTCKEWDDALEVILTYLEQKGREVKRYYPYQGISVFTDGPAEEFLKRQKRK